MSIQDVAQMTYLEHGQVDSTVTDDTFCKYTKSVLVAQKPDGTYHNIHADYKGDLKISMGTANHTAFGEIKVSEMTPIIQEIFSYDLSYTSSTRKFNVANIAGGNVIQANAMVVVSTSTTTGSTAHFYTKKRIRYRAGEGGDIRFTALFTSPVTGTYQQVGLGQDDDGFGWMYNTDQTFNIIHRNSASGGTVDTLYEQSTWDDPCDGTQTMPVIDWTKGNVFRIQYQWLGFGQIKFFIENPSTGEFVLVHKIDYSGANTVPSLSIPSLPISIKVNNGATTSNVSIKVGSMGAFIEGYSKLRGLTFSATNSLTGVTSTKANVLTIRNKSTFHSYTNHNEVFPRVVNIGTIGGTKPVTILLILNTTLGGVPSYVDVNANESMVDYDISGTTITGGYVLTSFVLGKEDRISIDLNDIDVVLQPSDILTIAGSTPAGSVDIFANITWIEDV